MIKSTSVSRLLAIVFLGFIVAGCGSNTSPSNTTSGTGSVALLLTDAPSDVFEEINITAIKAELLSDDGRVTIFEGERTFNLLDMTDATIFAVREGIAAGTYSKIRLTLSNIELVDYNGTDDPTDDLIYNPKLPGNGKLDLKPRGDFDIVAGDTLTIQIDIDAKKSIQIVRKGKKDEYNFRPVVFIDIDNDAFDQRLTKLNGDIDNIDDVNQSFDLCDTGIPVMMDDEQMKTDSRSCVSVETDDATAIFDSNGMPATFAALIAGEPATVFGRLQRAIGDAADSDSDSDTGNDSDKNDDAEKDEDDDDSELRSLVLKASSIELGPVTGFQKLDGTATSIVDANNQFDMDVAPGQGLTTPLNLKVQIQQGTMLVNLNGDPLDSSDIDSGELVNVRGVLDVDNNTLFASLIMVDTDSSTQLTGTVGANPDSSCGFTIMTASGDRSVATDGDTRAFLVTATSTTGSSSPIELSELIADQQADVFGNFVNGCFEADTIIAFTATPAAEETPAP